MTGLPHEVLVRVTSASNARASSVSVCPTPRSERLGYVVVRLVHGDLANPAHVVRLVRQGTERLRARAA
ncbi:hypothetical protein [uncultured Dermacoccus sp.]|uniref:hypothetical protein n=1 Tax=uncultured Dermacoccus sp. TaxID=339343 RepID=UPI0025992476|nr:hypothetical protein [uncultured Dermacoccus sp.]